MMTNGLLYRCGDSTVAKFCLTPAKTSGIRPSGVPCSEVIQGMDMFSEVETSNEVYKQDLPSSAFRAGLRVNNYKEINQNGMSLFKKGKRPIDLYEFDGKQLRKGDLIVAVLRSHIAKVNPSVEDLRTTFEAAQIYNFGLFQEEKLATERSKKYKRYLLDEGRIIEIKDGVRIAVTSQLTKENVKPFLAIAKKLGFKITNS